MRVCGGANPRPRDIAAGRKSGAFTLHTWLHCRRRYCSPPTEQLREEIQVSVLVEYIHILYDSPDPVGIKMLHVGESRDKSGELM